MNFNVHNCPGGKTGGDGIKVLPLPMALTLLHIGKEKRLFITLMISDFA
jgi:hypothetical protein